MGPAAPVIGIIVGALSAVTAVVGGIMQYQQGQKQARAARSQAEEQARAAESNATAARIAAQREEYQHRYRVNRLMGEQRAKVGASGVVMEGTPLAVMEETAYQSELDAMAIRYGGDVAAQRHMNEASAYRMGGSTMSDAYRQEAGTSLLTGFSSGLGRAVGAWDSYKSFKFNKVM